LEVEGIAHDSHQAIIRQHGADSDEARVEVYGQFPNQAINQFISHSLVQEAAEREVYHDAGAPLLMGVDVARGDRDYNVFAYRRGRDARSIPWKRFKSTDTVQVAQAVAEAAQRFGVDAIFVDGGGVGGGVVDMLKGWKFRIIEVQSGGTATDTDRYQNKRVENWSLMKEWLSIAAILDDPTLKSDLTSPELDYHKVTNKMMLESKEHMRDKRSLASPDMADALSMTFHRTIARNDSKVGQRSSRRQTMASGMDAKVFS
jgi:hypothetical protein